MTKPLAAGNVLTTEDTEKSRKLARAGFLGSASGILCGLRDLCG
jgi:hypothetical protein